MFSPLTMKHVLLQVMTDDLPQVSLTLAALSVFSPDHRVVYDQEIPVIPGGHYREMHNQARSRRLGSRLASDRASIRRRR